MLDSQTSLLISSVSINIILLIKDIFRHLKKSECCGSKIEMRTSGATSPEPKVEDNNNNNISQI